MSWLFSRALVAEYSADTCSAGEQSAPSNSTPTPQAYWSPGKTTDTFPRFRSGMTCERLTGDRGEDVLTSYLGAFHARTFPQPEKAQALMVSEADYGKNSRGSLAKYDRVSSSWRTRQFSLLGDLVEYSETWPRWGSMRNGVSFRRPTPSGLLEIRAYITNANASGLSRRILTPFGLSGDQGQGGGEFDKQVRQFVPTPLASDGEKGGPNQRGSKGDVMLPSAVLRLPTATSHDWKAPNRKTKSAASGHGLAAMAIPTPTASDGTRGGVITDGRTGSILPQAINTMVATPQARDYRNGKVSAETAAKNSRPLSEQVGGQLNPPWVEWLMGWPIGWTDCAPLETDKFRRWLRSHGEFLSRVCIDH